MADNSLAGFRAASEFAESAASFLLTLRRFADFDLADMVIGQIRIVQAELLQHRGVLRVCRDYLSDVADGVILCWDQHSPNAHSCVVDLLDRCLFNIVGHLENVRAFDSQTRRRLGCQIWMRFDPDLINLAWQAIRADILAIPFSEREATFLASHVVRERSKFIAMVWRPKSDQRKSNPRRKPTPPTMKVIKMIQKNKSITDICELSGKSAVAVRRIRCDYYAGKYQL
jgi:hypothetical protein